MPEISDIEPSQLMEHVKTPTVSPKIIFDKSLESPEVRYMVDLDTQMLTQLFRQNGMSDKDISEMKIVFARNAGRRMPLHFGMRPIASWEASKKEMRVGCDRLWKNQNSFKSVEGINPKVAILHESSHALDYATGKSTTFRGQANIVISNILASVAGIGAGYLASSKLNLPIAESAPLGYTAQFVGNSIAYYLRPTEKRARKFAKELGGKVDWQNLVALRPRNYAKSGGYEI